MLDGRSIALARVRVPRGEDRPPEAELTAALDRDRAVLHLPPGSGTRDLTVAGPYPVVVDGREMDEYVVWEH